MHHEFAPRTKRERGLAEHLEFIALRRARALGMVDLTRGRGLEIGPLDSAITDRASDDVRYTDLYDTEGMRRAYADDQNVLLENIPHIDFPMHTADGFRTAEVAAAEGAPYDWVMASHVVEHVPDLIGWLHSLAELTGPEGRVLLAAPNRQWTFDRLRPPTTVGQVVDAHEHGDTRPSLRAVYDSHASAVAVDAMALFAGERPPGPEARLTDDAGLRAEVERHRTGVYIDAHTWVFTDQEFLALIGELRRTGAIGWYVAALDQRENDIEFWVVLRKAEPGAEPADEVKPASDLPHWLDLEVGTRARVKELEASLAQRDAELAALRGSKAFRVGTALAALPRKVRRLRVVWRARGR